MAIVIQEYTGNDNISIVEDYTHLYGHSINTQEGLSLNEANTIDPNSIMVEIEGIHAYPHATRNFTRYMPKCLKASIESWTKPYNRPLIKHHNATNGETIGRIIDVQYKTNKTLSGTPALLFTVNVPDEKVKTEIKNGLLSTTSIGIIGNDVRCSICGQHVENGEECVHERGEIYTLPNGEKAICYWDIYEMEAKELSYVIVPSDIYAKTINIYPATSSKNKSKQIKESVEDNLIFTQKGDEQMDNKVADLEKQLKEANESIKQLKESVSSLEKEKEETAKTITSLTEEKEVLEKQIKELEEAKENEMQLKEGAENALAETKSELRNTIIENLQYLRMVSGKEALNEEVLKARTSDSIKDSIIDLKEELDAKNKKADISDLPTPGSVKNPAHIDEGKTDNGKDKIEKVKVKEKINSIDVQESLENVLSQLFRSR